MSRPKLLVVVQRYGDGVAGGAETHARELTKRLAPHLDVEVLVPTAHDEPALDLAIYEPVFHAPRAIAFNTEEERALVHTRFRNERIPSDILGVGVDVPEDRSADRFRQRWGIDGPVVLYIGRIVESKGCRELFANWARWRAAEPDRHATLVLIGQPAMAVQRRSA